MQIIRHIIIFIIALLATTNALAQHNPNSLPGTFGASDSETTYDPKDPRNLNDPYKPDGDEGQNDEQADTTKRKERKPLESFFFADSLRMKKIFAWSVNPEYNSVKLKMVDTLLQHFHIDYGFQREGVGSAYGGNVGSVTVPLNYFDRYKPSDFLNVSAWNEYILTPEKILFYNAKIPYTRLRYEMSGQTKMEEQLFNFVISQNISPSTSMNLQYNAEGTKGMYMNQKTLDRNFAFSLAHTGKKYAVHGGYIYNHATINENGGIVNDKDVLDTIISAPDQIEVKLKDAQNEYRGHTFWFTQSYGIPLRKQNNEELTIQKMPVIYVGQSFNYTNFKRTYQASGEQLLYENYLVSPNTYDTMAQSLIDVNAFVQLQPYNRDGALGLISGGIGTEFAEYYTEIPWSYRNLYGSGDSGWNSSAYVYGSLGGKISKYFDWGANMKYYIFGLKNQNLDINGNLRFNAYIRNKPIALDISAKYMLTAPQYWEQSYFSNHHAWSNQFDRTNSMLISAKFNVPHWQLQLGADYELTKGKIYLNENIVPVQFNDELSVLGIYLQKDFRIKVNSSEIQLNHRVLAQFSSNQEVVPVPQLSAYLSYLFEFNIVKNVLRMQIGVDGRFNTKYYAFGYDPALGQLYNQREREMGNYPYLDAFVAAKWKRMRILLKLQHFNANLFDNKDYFQLLDLPQNRMMFKLGVSWSFYD